MFAIILTVFFFAIPNYSQGIDLGSLFSTTDSDLVNSYFEKKYGTIEKLFNLIKEQEDETRYLREEHRSTEADSDNFFRRNPFSNRDDRIYYQERLQDAFREAKKSKERERKLKSDYKKWLNTKRIIRKRVIRKKSSTNSSSVGLRYTPPFLPLSISFDSEKGIILSAQGKIPTPIGTFEIYKNIAFPDRKTLTIVLGDKKHVYDLENRSFKVKLPNDLEGKSKVEYDGKGNIVVIVPNPVLTN